MRKQKEPAGASIRWWGSWWWWTILSGGLGSGQWAVGNGWWMGDGGWWMWEVCVVGRIVTRQRQKGGSGDLRNLVTVRNPRDHPWKFGREQGNRSSAKLYLVKKTLLSHFLPSLPNATTIDSSLSSLSLAKLESLYYAKKSNHTRTNPFLSNISLMCTYFPLGKPNKVTGICWLARVCVCWLSLASRKNSSHLMVRFLQDVYGNWKVIY